MKDWIKDNRRPDIIETFDNWGRSKKVIVLVDDKEPLVAEYNKGANADEEEWEQWYSSVYDDAIEGVTGWCDCVPVVVKTEI